MKDKIKQLQGKAKKGASKLGSDIKTSWNQLPPMVRVGAYLFGGIWAYRKISDAIKNGGTGKDAKNDIKKFEKEGQVATYPEATYSGYADIIYNEYMNDVWSDFDDIVYIFKKMENDIDVAKLIVAYGMRRQKFSLLEGNLQACIQSIDSDAPELINNIFATKGIKYRF
mgnify:CR=1 FL=1